MAVNWQVRSVSDSTIEEIKSKAKQRGLSIGQYLDWHFTNEIDVMRVEPKNNGKEYKLFLNSDTMNVLKRLAADKGYGVAKYLEEVVAKN